MATIIPFPNAMPIPVRGLTKQERDVLDAETTGLIHHGQATGVSIHNDGQFMCVYGCRGERYFIGRKEGMCYLFDDEESMMAKSRRSENVVKALEALLTSSE